MSRRHEQYQGSSCYPVRYKGIVNAIQHHDSYGCQKPGIRPPEKPVRPVLAEEEETPAIVQPRPELPHGKTPRISLSVGRLPLPRLWGRICRQDTPFRSDVTHQMHAPHLLGGVVPAIPYNLRSSIYKGGISSPLSSISLNSSCRRRLQYILCHDAISPSACNLQ